MAVIKSDADDEDMKALGAVREEPVITIGIDGETLDEGETCEESYVDDVNGGFLDPEMVREARVEGISWITSRCRCIVVSQFGFSHSDQDEIGPAQIKGTNRPPEIRCRLVAKEVKKRNNTEEESVNFFAS